MTNSNNNDDMKKIREELSKINDRINNVEKSVNNQDKMAKDIIELKAMMSKHFGEKNPPSATQSPKTLEDENSLDHDFLKNL